MNGNTGFGARAYAQNEASGGVEAADSHRLILMLYDGAIAAAHQGIAHLRGRDVPAKCAAVGKALRIVDEGLRAAVDRNAGGELASRLLDLYDYMTMRLLQANLRNDAAALDEVARLLSDLRSAWAQIRPAAPARTAAESAAAPATRRLAVLA